MSFDFEKVLDKAFDMLEKNLQDKKEGKAAEMQRLSDIAMEQEKTKRMGFSAQEQLQNLVNQGLLKKQEVENTGLMNREQLKESGLSFRQSQQNDFEASKPIFKEDKTKISTADGGVEERSVWRNYNTQAGRIDNTPGGSFDATDMEFFNNRRPEVQSSQGSRTGTRTLTNQDMNFQTPVENMPRNTGFVRVESGDQAGRTLNVGRDNGGDYQITEALPSRTHDLTGIPNERLAPNHTPMTADSLSQKQQQRTIEPSLPDTTRMLSSHQPIGAVQDQSTPFGQTFIRSNLGHLLGADKALNIANTFNRTLTGGWGLSNQVGNAMIERGIKPAIKWAGQEYQDPYERKIY